MLFRSRTTMNCSPSAFHSTRRCWKSSRNSTTNTATRATRIAPTRQQRLRRGDIPASFFAGWWPWLYGPAPVSSRIHPGRMRHQRPGTPIGLFEPEAVTPLPPTATITAPRQQPSTATADHYRTATATVDGNRRSPPPTAPQPLPLPHHDSNHRPHHNSKPQYGETHNSV